jgi:lipid-A-disaccharide synthase
MPENDLARIFQGKVFISACEPSADLYAALFIRRFLKNRPDLKIVGIGGPEMAACGVELLGDYRDLMAFGLSAAAQNAGSNWSAYRAIARKIYRYRPAIFMPVAYPGMNLLLCRYARRLGIKTIYLLPPQIWAWGSFRKYFLNKWIDQVISLFPFEYEYYKRLHIPTIYLDNPLTELLKSYKSTDHTKTIGFMPGSRPKEIKRNLPVILKLIDHIKAKDNGFHFRLILREKIDLHQFLHLAISQVFNDRYQAMKNCDLIVTCSGTASLEAAFLGIPQVFFNRPSYIDYHFMRRFVKIGEFNLTNLYFGKKLVPVFIDRHLDHLSRTVSDEILKVYRLQTGLE